jgi:predicted PurR-regulated permease PerM
LRVVGALCTVAVIAASYFFIVKPTLDTTGDVFDSVATPLQQVQEQVQEAQEQAEQAKAQGGGKSSQVNLERLQRCVQKAGQNVNSLQRCTSRFAP